MSGKGLAEKSTFKNMNLSIYYNFIYLIHQIISRYDIIVVMEVVDSKEKAQQKLLDELNKVNKEDPYKFVASPRIGRTSYKEQ